MIPSDLSFYLLYATCLDKCHLTPQCQKKLHTNVATSPRTNTDQQQQENVWLEPQTCIVWFSVHFILCWLLSGLSFCEHLPKPINKRRECSVWGSKDVFLAILQFVLGLDNGQPFFLFFQLDALKHNYIQKTKRLKFLVVFQQLMLGSLEVFASNMAQYCAAREVKVCGKGRLHIIFSITSGSGKGRGSIVWIAHGQQVFSQFSTDPALGLGGGGR